MYAAMCSGWISSPARNAGGHHERGGFVLEVRDGEVSVRLVLTTVQRKTMVTCAGEILKRAEAAGVGLDTSRDLWFVWQVP